MTKKEQETASDSPNQAPEAVAAGDGEESLEQQLENALTEADKQRDLHLRAVAEIDNVRKRSEERLAEQRKYAAEDFARSMLEVKDSLEAAETAIKSGNGVSAGITDGVRLTLQSFSAALARAGVQEVDPAVGDTFDPTVHNAIGRVPCSGKIVANTIAQVIRKGYTLNGRILRSTDVLVASADSESKENKPS